MFNNELLQALFADLWEAIGVRASTCWFCFTLEFCSCLGWEGGRRRGKRGKFFLQIMCVKPGMILHVSSPYANPSIYKKKKEKKRGAHIPGKLFSAEKPGRMLLLEVSASRRAWRYWTLRGWDHPLCCLQKSMSNLEALCIFYVFESGRNSMTEGMMRRGAKGLLSCGWGIWYVCTLIQAFCIRPHRRTNEPRVSSIFSARAS